MDKTKLIQTVKELVPENETVLLNGDRSIQNKYGKLHYVTTKKSLPESKMKKYTIANIIFEVGDKKIRKKLTEPIKINKLA